MSKGQFTVENLSDTKKRYHINGVIGDWGNTSLDVISFISYEADSTTDIEVVIQSPGGSAFEGIAIHNALKAHPAHVTTKVLGAAASAGSIIFMAGDTRIMPENTYLMIHEPTLGINGKASELREAADLLDGITKSLIVTYGPHVNISEDELLALIVKQTWINAKDAQSMGFATEVSDGLEAVALSRDFTQRFDSLPAPVEASTVKAFIDNIHTIKDLERSLRDSGCSKAMATALASKARDIGLSDSAQDSELILSALKTFSLT